MKWKATVPLGGLGTAFLSQSVCYRLVLIHGDTFGPRHVPRRLVDAGSCGLDEWAAEPGAPGSSVHIHKVTDEAFYVLEGTFGFQVGEETVEGSAGAFVFVPKGIVHAFWNQGPSPARMLVMMSPPGFVRYLEELAEGLATVGDSEEAAMELRQKLSEKYDVEVVGPPRQATS